MVELACDTEEKEGTMKNEAGWHYSMWTGIMYGRVPVGIILVTIGFIFWYAAQ
jgi:hypothetical protein